MMSSEGTKTLGAVLLAALIAVGWSMTAAAQQVPDETAGDIVDDILPNAGDLLPAAGRAGCGGGEAGFFNNDETCASMGAKPTVPVMGEAECDIVSSHARPIDRPIRFALDRSDIEADYADYLENRVAVALNDERLRPCLQFVVEGHTDASGSAAYNQDLSNRRADSVVEFLVAHGVDRSRLRSMGHGENRLLNPAEPTAAENRRVTFRPERLAAN